MVCDELRNETRHQIQISKEMEHTKKVMLRCPEALTDKANMCS